MTKAASLSHSSPGLHCLFIVALFWVLKDIHDLGMRVGGEWMLPRVPGDGSAENSELCQAKQGRPRELQRPAEPEAVLELPKEGKRNLPKTLKPRVRLRPIYQTNATWVLLPGVMKVSTNRQFHMSPQRKGWRLPVSWPPSESRRQQRGAPRPRSIAQPRSFPQNHLPPTTQGCCES